ncbi:MAG: hypothetical protein ACKOBM_01220 [Gammaproteobacteria bacterium]
MNAPETWLCAIVRRADLTARTGRTPPIQQILLAAPDAFQFAAGQYLEVLHPAGPIPMSIASSPARLPELELHYRATPGVPEATWMDELLAHGAPLRIRGPGGDVVAPMDPARPLLLIAGGTGITQALAILETAAHQTPRATVRLLWCADREDEFYCRDRLAALSGDWLEIDLCADARRGPDNAGLIRARAAAAALPDAWIMLGGSPPFVFAMDDALATVTHTPRHADAFAWASRPNA